MRYFINIAYNGLNYCGWQIQPNGTSVQECVQKALSTILRTEISVTGAGRTDAGVHARNMTAHFDTEHPIANCIQLTTQLNSLLPHDIAINNIFEVNSQAHARFDALSRCYEYHLIQKKSVFLHNLAARINGEYDIDKMNEAAKILFNYTDFTSFSKLHTDVKTNNCTIKKAYWKKEGDELVFTIEADRFLRNMVRAIVGTLLDVGRGKISITDFDKIIHARNRCSAGHSAPACGLYFIHATYPDWIKKTMPQTEQ